MSGNSDALRPAVGVDRQRSSRWARVRVRLRPGRCSGSTLPTSGIDDYFPVERRRWLSPRGARSGVTRAALLGWISIAVRLRIHAAETAPIARHGEVESVRRNFQILAR